MSYREVVSPQGRATIKKKATLTLNPLTVNLDEDDVTTFTGKLADAKTGNGIENKNIHFFLDGVDKGVVATTDVNGDFSFNYKWTIAGDFLYEVQYLGD